VGLGVSLVCRVLWVFSFVLFACSCLVSFDFLYA
jgi:hypothetical protein